MSVSERPLPFGGDPLDTYTWELTGAALRGELEPVRCRERETNRLIAILLRQSKNNPVLLGEAGVGKTAVVEGLAQRIVDGDVPDVLKNTRIHALSHLDLIAGSMYRGQYEKRLKGIVDRASNDPDAILFIDELHNLIGAGSALGQPMDAANMLKPALTRGRIRIIGATTRAEFERWIRPDAALERRFQPLEVSELTTEQTIEVLEARRPRLESHHLLAIPDEVLCAAVTYADERFPRRRQPDKSIDLLDEACSMRRVRVTVPLPDEIQRLADQRARLVEAERRLIGELFDAGAGNLIERVSYGTFRAFENVGLVMERIFTGQTTQRAGPQREIEDPSLLPEAKRLAEVHAQRLTLDDRLREALVREHFVLTLNDIEAAGELA